MNIHDLTDTEKIEYLIHFENEIAQIYETAAIKGPIHLRGGNEKILIKIFKQINTDDTVFATWANHLEALLHCIPREKVKKRILDGHSMAMNFPEYNFYTSTAHNWWQCNLASGGASHTVEIQFKPANGGDTAVVRARTLIIEFKAGN